ncbi:MAG: hypothetical protein C0432_00130 [Candidatus Puniceispirillum sp.]|nr:hypothetical protein [Candidatus Pelagibacter sp.]MBA4282690.1 hypothetical protein [Candidatus Puniceispirillum sp.]
MKIKHILLLSTLALPFITPNIVFSSEASTTKDKAKDVNLQKTQEMSSYYSEYARTLDKTRSLDNDYVNYFNLDTPTSSSNTIEPYKNKTADINAWKNIILNHQYLIRDEAHRTFIKNLTKKETELSKEEVQLLFYTQHYIKNCIKYTAIILSEFSKTKSPYSEFKNALAIAAFGEIFADDDKLKEIQSSKSLKMDSQISINDAREANKYDVYVEAARSEDAKDFSLPQDLKDDLQKLGEEEKLRLQKNGGLIVQISQLVRLGAESSEASKIINEGYILFSVTLDNKFDIKNVYIIRLTKPDSKNTTTQKDSEIFSSNELSRKIQSLTIDSRSPSPSFDKENIVERNQVFDEIQRDVAGQYDTAIRERNAQERDYRASDFARYSPENSAALADSYNASRKKGYIKGYSSRNREITSQPLLGEETAASATQDRYKLPPIANLR